MKHLRAHPSMCFVCTKNLSLWLQEFIVCYKGYPLKSWASEILTWMWSIGTSFQARNEANGCMYARWPHTWKASYAHDRTHERPPMLMTAHIKGLLCSWPHTWKASYEWIICISWTPRARKHANEPWGCAPSCRREMVGKIVLFASLVVCCWPWGVRGQG